MTYEEYQKFKRLIIGGGLGVFIFLFLCLTIYNIRPGEVGVVVNLLREDTNVETKELTVGMHFVAPWRSIYRFPIFEQTHQWVGEEAFVFQTSEGMTVSADLGISYHIEPDKIHLLFNKFRRGMEEITHLFIKNHIRDAINKSASRMKIEEIYGTKKEEFFKEIHTKISSELTPLGFSISHIYIIGQFSIPEVVMQALNKKIEASQRAQQRENELRETEAEAKKVIAKSEGEAQSRIIDAKAYATSLMIETKAKADSNTLLTHSLNKNVLQWHYISKWNGKLPQVTGNQGASILMDGELLKEE